jgi:hypothetical protein
MDDEIIKKVVWLLNKKSFVPKMQGKLENGVSWESFVWEPLFYQNKTYRLVWYWESNKNFIWVLNCFRRSKYEKS